MDVVQLHGEEGPDYCRWIDRPILKRFLPADGETVEALSSLVASYRVSAVLLDPQPVVVAGGLTPDNVGRAIRIARPYAVDVCSGVERGAGRKSRERMAAFVRAVRREDAVRDAR